jgi:class 3 adenylate cyclase
VDSAESSGGRTSGFRGELAVPPVATNGSIVQMFTRGDRLPRPKHVQAGSDEGWQTTAAHGPRQVDTARAFCEHRAVIDALVARHGGRTVKTTGEGVLVEFPSVIYAVAAQRREGAAESHQ